jgi:hypothetical protein
VAENGEGQEAPGGAPQVLTFGAPTAGEILADRYQLEGHVADDSHGRQLWRGVDVILRRPVAVVLRYPGGDSAGEMLSAAVAASRIVHPHLVGVYDAIDEGERAYVVREWVDGSSLRELVDDGPLDPDRAATIACAVADALAAIHASGMAHGNIHPGTVLIAGDGRVVLTDARADEATTTEADLRAVGAILYCALTAYWPHAEAGPTPVPDAPRDHGGTLPAPRQVRGGVPGYLDELTMALLDPEVEVPAAEVLVGELSRFEQDGTQPILGGEDSLGFRAFDSAAETDELPRPVSRKILIGIVSLLVIALAGVLGTMQALSGRKGADTVAGGVTGTSAPQRGATKTPVDLHIAPDQVRIVDGAGGSRAPAELANAANAVDGNLNTQWKTQSYNPPAEFGNLKKGMGILIDLGQPKPVGSVQVELSTGGATLELKSGDSVGGTDAAADAAVENGFQLVGEPKTATGTKVILPCDPSRQSRYLMVWITKLAPDGKGRFALGVQEITLLPQ